MNKQERSKRFKSFFLTFFLLSSSLITIYPSKKENTNLFDYCYSLEKILFRNSIEKSKNLSRKFNPFTKEITLFGTKKTKGGLASNIIDQYKISKNLFIINFLPNQIICLGGYWIEVANPGTFKSIFYEKSNQKINEYKKIKKEVNEFIKEINTKHKSIKKEIKDLF